MTDEMDAVGLNDFLPNRNLEMESNNRTDSLNSSIKSIITKQIEQKARPIIRRKGKDTKEIEEQLVGEFGIAPYGEEGGNGHGSHTGGGNESGGLSQMLGKNEIDTNTEGSIDKKRERKPSSKAIRIEQKYLCLNRSKGKYRFIISSNKSLEKGRLAFQVMGEQHNYDLPIKNAISNDLNVKVEKISSNMVYLNSLSKNTRFQLDIEIDYPDYCVMEVELYED